MKFKKGDFVFCVQGSRKCLVEGTGSENGYEYYHLLNIKTKHKETLLVDFVDKRFFTLKMGVLKKVFYKLKSYKGKKF